MVVCNDWKKWNILLWRRRTKNYIVKENLYMFPLKTFHIFTVYLFWMHFFDILLEANSFLICYGCIIVLQISSNFQLGRALGRWGGWGEEMKKLRQSYLFKKFTLPFLQHCTVVVFLIKNAIKDRDREKSVIFSLLMTFMHGSNRYDRYWYVRKLLLATGTATTVKTSIVSCYS